MIESYSFSSLAIYLTGNFPHWQIIWPFHWVKKEVDCDSLNIVPTPRDLRNIHTIENTYRDTLLEISARTHFHAQNDTGITPVILPADGETSRSLLPSSIYLLSNHTVQPENNCFCIFKVIGKVWKAKKRKESALVTGTASFRHPNSLLSDLMMQISF